MFTKGQSGELALVTSSNIPSPLYLFSQILPPVYKESFEDGRAMLNDIWLFRR